MTKEIWKDIPGYEGEYQVSDKGHIKSLGRRVKLREGTTRFHKGRILKLILRHNGYYRVNLRGTTQKLVHRLVLEAFVGLCPKGMECRHLNGIKTDNKLANLAWGTRNENMQDRIKNGNINRGEQRWSSKLTESDVFEIREKLSMGVSHSIIAKQYGVSRSQIGNIANKKKWGWLELQPCGHPRSAIKGEGLTHWCSFCEEENQG